MFSEFHNLFHVNKFINLDVKLYVYEWYKEFRKSEYKLDQEHR